MEFSASQKIYALLLRAYPRRHRAEYGAAMLQLFRDQCRDAWTEDRGWGMTKLWLRLVPDLINSSILERLAALKERKTVNENIASLSTNRNSPAAIFAGVFLVVFLITTMLATVVTYILPESYASTCKIKIERDPDGPALAAGTNSTTIYDPYFIQTEFEVMNSMLVLSNVIAKLNLNVEWGKKYFNGETLKTTEAMEILRGRMALAPLRNTQIIAITVYSDDKNEAALIANAVADSYREYRIKSNAALEEKTLEILHKQSQGLHTQSQEMTLKISELQPEVESLRQKYGIPENPDKIVLESQEKEERYAMMQTQLSQLQKMDKQQLRSALPMVAPDGTLSDLMSQYNEAERSLAVATNSAPINEQKVTRAKTLLKKLDTQADERVAGLMAGLQTQVTSFRAGLDSLAPQVQKAKPTDETKAYWDKKYILNEMLSSHELLVAKITNEEMANRTPKPELVQIVDLAEPGRFPVKPNKALNIVIGMGAGIVLGCLAGALAVWVSTSRANRRAAAV